MDRREAIKRLLDQGTSFAGSAMLLGCCSCTKVIFDDWGPKKTKVSSKVELETQKQSQIIIDNQYQNLQNEGKQHITQNHRPHSQLNHQQENKIRNKMANFDQNHPDDVFLTLSKRKTFHSCYRKLQLFSRYIGYGHFNLASFDDFIKYSKSAPRLEPLTKQELRFLEEVFFFPAEKYGFFGKKLQTNITAKIPNREIVKIPFSGHYLYRDVSYPIYQRIKKDVGRSIILTSGIRSVVKQFHLFFAKTIKSEYNLSQASRSLAPPGYSYHSVGDFDVGKKGLGTFNFTDKFSQTDEYRKLIDLGYIDIRYPDDNPFGVRFEPWHIEGKSHRV